MKNLTQTARPITEARDQVWIDIADAKPELDAFHRKFYASRQTHGMTYYEGIPILKNPMDLWVCQEIIWDLRPTLIVETGTACGGSALFYARQFDRIGQGMVVSVDIEPATDLPKHDRITFMPGMSSTDQEVVRALRACASTHPRVMVVLDSDHGTDHVLSELEAYAPMVSKGQFLVVEDTNINGRPVCLDWNDVPGNGPGPAVDQWLPRHPEFSVDAMAHRYMLTFHTWLRRS